MPKDNSVDEFAQAVAALVPHAEPAAVARLALATRRLLESLADRAAVQSASAFMAAYQDLRNVDNNARMVAEDQEGRISTLEEHEGEATAPHTD
jgi:hypothetical protein